MGRSKVLSIVSCFSFLLHFYLVQKYVPGQGRQSGVFCTFGPLHVAPPFNGIGLLQFRVRFWPIGDRPGHRHSVHWLHALQPPFTEIK